MVSADLVNVVSGGSSWQVHCMRVVSLVHHDSYVSPTANWATLALTPSGTVLFKYMMYCLRCPFKVETSVGLVWHLGTVKCNTDTHF